jgi:hypothetical protein
MRGVRISYLIEHPEYIPLLAQWLFEHWGSILGEETPEARIKKLKAHIIEISCLLHGLRMRMANFWELPPFACMILRDAKI